MRESGKDLTIPALNIAGMAVEQGLVKPTLQAKALAPFRRRRCIDAPVVAAQTITQHHIDFLQLHCRQRCHLIDPAQAPTVYKYFRLTPKPIGQGRGLCLSH